MNAPLGCHAISLTPVRFDTWRAVPPAAGITKTLPPERKAIDKPSGDQRALGGGPGSLERRAKPEPSGTLGLRADAGARTQRHARRQHGDRTGYPARHEVRASITCQNRLWLGPRL